MPVKSGYRIRIFCILLMMAAAVAGCFDNKKENSRSATRGNPSANSFYPTIVLEKYVKREIDNAATLYQLSATSGLLLDITKFGLMQSNSVPPDMVQMVLGPNIYKLLNPQITNLFVIDKASLLPVRGPPFSGFRTHDKGMFAIGHTMPERPGKDSLAVYWIATFQVE